MYFKNVIVWYVDDVLVLCSGIISDRVGDVGNSICRTGAGNLLGHLKTIIIKIPDIA